MSIVIMLLAFCAMGLMLWILARRCARRRRIELGSFPALACAAAGLTATAVAENGGVAIGTAVVGIWIAATVDFRCGYVFDPLVATSVCAVFVAAAGCGVLREAAAGAASTSGILFAVRALSLGRGLGFGDVKAGALVGAGLGIVDGVTAVGVGFVVGAASVPALVAFGNCRPRAPLPFTPYLLAGTVLVLAYHRFNAGVFQ